MQRTADIQLKRCLHFPRQNFETIYRQITPCKRFQRLQRMMDHFFFISLAISLPDLAYASWIRKPVS
jgi:hypothetical protein